MTNSNFSFLKRLLCLLVSWFTLLASLEARSEEPEDAPGKAPSRFAVVVLGTAQDAGYPQAGCNKSCCSPAWEAPELGRFPTSIALVDRQSKARWLFDCTWQLPGQLRMLDQICPAPAERVLDGVFLTHAHMGHYTGLMHLGREVMGAKEVPVYAMPRMQKFLTENGPWSQLVRLENIDLISLAAGQSTRPSEEIEVEPLLVPHRDEFSETVGFVISVKDQAANLGESSACRVLYLPDIDKWSRWETRIEDVVGSVDLAFIDATFFGANELPGRDMSEIPHPFVEESIRRFQALPASERGKIHFIHLNHTNPALSGDSLAAHQIEKAGMHVAQQGHVYSLEKLP